MSKKQSEVVSNSPGLSYGYGLVSFEDIQDRIVGKVLGIIELAGLTEKQENSAKDLIRKAVWDAFDGSILITPERHEKIRDDYYKKKKEIGGDFPMSAI